VHPEPELWSRFGHDPRSDSSRALRASDADREVAREALAEAYADGRLDRAELDDRLDALTTCRRLAGLVPLLDDLVPATEAPAVAPSETLRAEAVLAYEAQRRRALLAMLVPSLVCTVIWFVSGFGPDGWHLVYPWPLLVVLGTGLAPLRTMIQRQDIIVSELRRLEKKQRKALGSGADHARLQSRPVEQPHEEPETP
jgi:hypothetical protein